MSATDRRRERERRTATTGSPSAPAIIAASCIVDLLYIAGSTARWLTPDHRGGPWVVRKP